MLIPSNYRAQCESSGEKSGEKPGEIFLDDVSAELVWASLSVAVIFQIFPFCDRHCLLKSSCETT